MRTIAKRPESVATLEGGGVPIRRVFPTDQLEDLDPFLLLDQMGPNRVNAGESTGFPHHPHRGFETVTYLLEGQMEHRDSFGNWGLIGPGDVQWMTAGSGLIHSEMPGPELVRNGGTLHGFQLWVNLPRGQKMAAPHYQDLKAPDVPTKRQDGATVRIIAGEGGAADTRTPILYQHVTLDPGAQHTQAVPKSWNAFAYYFQGKRAGDVEVFGHDGDEVTLSNQTGAPLDVLLIAGEPIGEPVARYGPFVMNTREELQQAVHDFRSGKMGSLNV
jgi:quercetin 2,3-dioxygenase